jgi:hypothetical protein
VIEPFLPTGAIIGHPIESKYTSVTINQIPSTIKTMDLTVGDAAKYFDDEISISGFPDSYVEDDRSITGSLGLRFRKAEAARFYAGFNGVNVPWEIVFGHIAGQMMKVNMGKVNMEIPKLTDNKPAVDMDIPIKALGTLGEDSMSLTFY